MSFQAKCFAAGKTKHEAAQCLAVLRDCGINIILDPLGETAEDEKSARLAEREYIEYMEWAVEHNFWALAVKLSKLGIEFDPDLAGELFTNLLHKTIRLGVFLEIDAEYPHTLSKVYTLLNIIKLRSCGDAVMAPFRVMFPANQGCICEARLKSRRCEIIGPEYCSDRYLIQFRSQNTPVQIAQNAYPGDIPSDLISDRYISLIKRSPFVAGATHDMLLFLRSLPYILEAQMFFGVHMGLQMEIGKATSGGKLKEWVVRFIEKRCHSKEIEQVLNWASGHTPELIPILKGERHLAVRKFSCRAPMGPNYTAYPECRIGEGIRNIPEALWWRMRYAPTTFFSH